VNGSIERLAPRLVVSTVLTTPSGSAPINGPRKTSTTGPFHAPSRDNLGSLDHLIGPRLQRGGHVHAKQSGRCNGDAWLRAPGMATVPRHRAEIPTCAVSGKPNCIRHSIAVLRRSGQARRALGLRSGQTRKSALETAMSAFPAIATKLWTSREVRFVPVQDSRTAANDMHEPQ
jgi:hypothetical protein